MIHGRIYTRKHTQTHTHNVYNIIRIICTYFLLLLLLLLLSLLLLSVFILHIFFLLIFLLWHSENNSTSVSLSAKRR